MRRINPLLPIAVILVLAAALGGAETAIPRPAAKPVIDAAGHINLALPDCGLQKAIDEAAAQGGGIVRIPEGVFALRRGLVLKDNVEIVGAGMDKTVLTPARKLVRIDVAEQSPKEGKVFLKDIPEGLDIGSAVVSCRRFPPPWYGSPRPAWVKEIDREAKTVTLEAPYGLNGMKPGVGYLIFGDAAALEKDIAKGDTEIVLKSASMFKPGDELAIGEPPNESLKAHAFVREVKGNTLVLEAPAQIDFAAWPEKKKIGNKKVNALIWALFPMIHGANVSNAAVRDLTCRAELLDNVRTTQGRFTVSGIHMFNGKNIVYERVAVRDWPADGISLQTGDACKVIDCEATGCAGNGFHPGTGLKDTLFDRCLAEGNGTGLYFCWHNRGHVIRNSRFINNRGGGIGGLGNPGDRNNTIENNLIAGNGGPGIAINGGVKSGNVIRNNVIENNSKSKPGKHPGIALHARSEHALDYTITGNTIRDTRETPTQYVGIEEKNGTYRKKPTRADENVIKGNSYSGHRTADVIVVGPNTVCEEGPDARVVKKIEPPKETKAAAGGAT